MLFWGLIMLKNQKWANFQNFEFFGKISKGGTLGKFWKKPKKFFFEKKTIIPKILHNTHMRSHKKFCAKKMSFRGVFGLFYQKYPKGGPLENFEKKQFFFFFESPLKSFKILTWGHTKNFGPKKWFLGVLLEGGSQREKKSNLAFGVWTVLGTQQTQHTHLHQGEKHS